MPANLFASTHGLETIDLSHNEIEHISSDVFPIRIGVSYVDLSHNRIQTLEGISFANLYQLQSISFAHNELRRIDAPSFATKYLKSVDFSNNLLLQIDCETFRYVPFEVTLNLSGNHHAEFNANCFQFEEDTSYYYYKGLSFANIDLSGTRITEMDIPESTRFQTLKLWLKDIATINLPTFFRHFEKLMLLNLSGSEIDRLNITTFARLSNLEELYLSGCKLTYISFGTFSSQTKLQILDISYNNLQHIDFNAFWPGLTNIKEVRVNGNDLVEIPGLTRKMFPELATLDITENYIQCLSVISIIQEMGWPINQQIYDLNTSHVSGIACIDPFENLRH